MWNTYKAETRRESDHCQVLLNFYPETEEISNQRDRERERERTKYFLNGQHWQAQTQKEKKWGKDKAPFSSRKFSTLSKIQNMKIFNVF